MGAVQLDGDAASQELQGKKLTHGRDRAARRRLRRRTRCSTASCRSASSSRAHAKAPDIASAVAAVSLKKADAVFAPESQGKGLKKVFDVRGRVPNPAFCEVGIGAGAGRGEQGQGGGARPRRGRPGARRLEGGGRRSRIARWPARMGARARRPVMVEPEVVRLEDQDVLVPPTLEPALPELKYAVLAAERRSDGRHRQWSRLDAGEPFSWQVEAPSGERLRVAAARRDRRERRLLRAARGSCAATSTLTLDGITRINSCGVREWVNFVRDLQACDSLWFARCSPTVVMQLNTIYNFRGARGWSSFLAPYVCEACHVDEYKLLDVAEHFPDSAPRTCRRSAARAAAA